MRRIVDSRMISKALMPRSRPPVEALDARPGLVQPQVNRRARTGMPCQIGVSATMPIQCGVLGGKSCRFFDSRLPTCQ
jgi:hypothetical protein